MRRRAFLGAVGAAGAAVASGTATATTAGAVGTRGGESFAPTGSVDVPGAAEAVVGPDGETAYVATGDGFATVDVSTPSSPSVLARVTGIPERREQSLESVLDVKLDGQRLLVSGPAQRGSLRGLIVYDVSDPASPVPATDFYETGFRIHNCYLSDGHAFLTNNSRPGRPLTVVDVASDPPREVGRWSPLDSDQDVDGWDDLETFPGVLHDVYVQEETAYCAYWDGGTWIVDVSDPAEPAFVGYAGDYSRERLVELANNSGETGRLFVEAPGNDHYVTVTDDGSLMGVGAEAWDRRNVDGDGPGGIRLYDVSDPSSPELQSRIEPESAPDLTRGGVWTTSHNFDFRDGRLYSSWYEAGVKIHDVSDPTDPEQMAWWRRPDEAMFWTAQAAGPETFVASSHPRRNHRAALYVFPDRAGQQENPPALGDPTPTPTTEGDGGDGGDPTATGDPTETADGNATDTEERRRRRRQPGFGALAAVAGLGAGAYHLLRNDEE